MFWRFVFLQKLWEWAEKEQPQGKCTGIVLTTYKEVEICQTQQ
jgi:hypothetical protein